jgi:hypothetical protein
MFRAISGKIYKITIATTYFAMIKDGVNEEFVGAIDVNGAWLF